MKDPEPETLGERVALLRNEAELSTRELGSLAGLSSGYISLLERNRKGNPTWDTIEGLCSVFGCSVDWLTRGEGRRPSRRALSAALDEAKARKGAA